MKKSLIIYSSVDGHTEKISKKISENLVHSHEVDLISLDEVKSKNLNDFDQIVIGASIRYGNYRKELFKFVDENVGVLSLKENAFFSVNVVARKKEKNNRDTNPYILKFLNNTKWNPKIIDVFAGVVDYPSYKYFDKFMIRLIMFITKGPINTKNKYDFTDWERVQKFSNLLSDK